MAKGFVGLRVALIAALLCVGLPLSAMAQMRQFTGRVDKVGAKSMTVDNRMGDKVSFVRVAETAVRGEKSSWDALAAADWVTISWKFVDKPRKAYVVDVLPPKKED